MIKSELKSKNDIDEFIKYLQNIKSIYQNEDILINNIVKKYFNRELYQHQLEQLKYMLKHNEGFFNDCCGSGKTLIELSYIIIRHYKDPSNIYYTGESILFVVPRISLLLQHHLNFKFKHSLFYTDNKEISNITFCVSKSLEQISNHNFDTIIFDEAHHDYTGIFNNIVKQISKFNKGFYFSATLNLQRLINLNKEFLEFTHFEAVELNIVSSFKLYYYIVKNRNDQNEILSAINSLLLNKPKNIETMNKILIMCNSVIDKNNSCIGVKSVESNIKSFFKSQNNNSLKINSISSDTNKIETEKILNDFENNINKHVIVNCNCISEGIDLSSVDTIIFKDDRFSKVGLIQSVGRVVRKYKNKSNKIGNLIFFIEDDQKYLTNFRNKILSKLLLYNQDILYNSQIINNNKHYFKNIEELILNQNIIKNIIVNDEITMLKFRLDILKNYIMTVKFPNSYVLPYITEDTKFRNINLFKYKNKYFKLVDNLNDVIKIFRRKIFADKEIIKILTERYNNDFKNFKISDKLEKYLSMD